jgi:hypothetical protein
MASSFSIRRQLPSNLNCQGHYHLIKNCPWFLKKWILFCLSNLRAECNLRAVPSNLKLPSYSDFNYLQKVNAKCPQIPDEKNKFCSIDKIFFILFLKHQKLFVKEAKLFFFIRNLRAFCIYFLQVHKIRIWGHLPFAGIACKIFLLMPSNFDEKNALWLWFILPSENNGIYDN